LDSPRGYEEDAHGNAGKVFTLNTLDRLVKHTDWKELRAKSGNFEYVRGISLNSEPYPQQAEIRTRALAETGIVRAIDEVTGYERFGHRMPFKPIWI